MKHILPILTAALALTASTAFAALTFEVVETPYEKNAWWTPPHGSDQYYKIVFTGGSGDFYISDWISGIGSSETNPDGTPKLMSTIANVGVTQYGYYYVNSNDKSLIGTGDIKDVGANENRIQIEEKTFASGETVHRYGYKLGTFKAGDEIEIYMATASGSARSNSGYVPGTPYYGGYDSRNNVDELVKYNLAGGTQQAYDQKGWTVVEDAKTAMPLAELAVNGLKTTRVFYGFYVGTGKEGGGGGGETFGSPLPGGLQIALIAGLFGLGFWYVRRRKAIAG